MLEREIRVTPGKTIECMHIQLKGVLYMCFMRAAQALAQAAGAGRWRVLPEQAGVAGARTGP